MLECRDISYSYKKNNPVLKNISFVVESNEVVGVVGPSGAGKSTLAKILGGLLPGYQGDLILNGKRIESTGFRPLQIIMQHPEKSVDPNWKMERILQEAGSYDEELLIHLGIEKEWLTRWPNELSGGQLQRFCIARVLQNDTKYIIADEITTMLDAVTQAEIWSFLLSYCKKRQIGLIVITHSSALASQICTRIVTIEDLNCKKTENLQCI